MAGFFKKALGVFVEFDEEQQSENTTQNKVINTNPTSKNVSSNNVPAFTQTDIEKFEKHFEKLFEAANLQGPDYFEFWKMMETLEAHIADEGARMSAVYASLAIQGLSKQKLIDSARQYHAVIEKDKAEFEKVVDTKAKAEVDGRKNAVVDLEKKIVSNSEMIKKLTQEIVDAQDKIAGLKNEIVEAEGKITGSKGGYNVACQAMLSKISKDLEKIETILK